WVALQQGVTESEQYTRIFNVLIFTAMPSAFVAMGLFSVLLIASDMAQDLKEHSILDMLTRTLNRRGIEEAIRPAFAQARRYAQPLAVVMTDIDFFKAINDDYGHVTGDNALTMFADILKSQLRTEDIVGRMGGEEFIIVLPNTDSEKAHLMIERLRRVIASTLITSNEYKFNMTASFGLTLLTDEDEDMEDAIRRADEALYIAKERGRNRIEFG
ncbi:MAG: GGDEF domain-containing protein, partial [Gammaproteobacteria bacterium]|nr:GGDEF domain-containing protein [Gammaproteobacteria bacterium]